MKTYRLYSLKIINENAPSTIEQNIAIEDGLIINMEDLDKKWLIDAIIEKSDKPLFEAFNKDSFSVEVIITSKDNLPAKMQVSIRNITQLSNKVGILLEGKMNKSKRT